jgi:predicted permease
MKVFYSITCLAASLGLLYLSIMFLLYEVVSDSCNPPTSWFCIQALDFYSTSPASNITSTLWLSYLIGGLLLLLFLNIATFFAYVHRRLASSTLGDAFATLSLQRREKLSKTTNWSSGSSSIEVGTADLERYMEG